MRRAVLLLLLLGAPAHAGEGFGLGWTDAFPARSARRPMFEFLPLSGAGAPVASDLCDAVQSGDKAGASWCLRGDGTMATGSALTLAAVGSPTTQTRPLCPNGPSCASATAQRLDGVDDAFKSADVALSPGDKSICAVVSHDSPSTGFQQIVSHDEDTAGNRGITFNTNTSGQLQFGVFKADASFTQLTGATVLTARAWNLVCATYDYVSDGASVMRLYVNGAADANSSTTAVGPLQAAAGVGWAVGYRPYTGNENWTKGAYRGVFVTEKVLSADDILRLSNVVHGVLSGSRGEAMTFARSGVQACDNGAGSVTILPANRPCVARGGYVHEGAGTNLVLRSEELNNGSWLVSSANSATNAATAPDGTSTMDAVTSTTTTGTLYQGVTVSSGTGPWTHSAWGISPSGTRSASINLGCATGNPATCTCKVVDDGSACTGTIAGAVCAGSASFSDSTTKRIAVTLTCDAANTTIYPSISGGVYNSSTGSHRWWGHQVETGKHATSYVRTEGSTAPRAASSLSVANPLYASNPSTYCIGGRIDPGSVAWADLNAGSGAVHFSIGSAGVANSLRFRNLSGSATIVWDWYNGAGAEREASVALTAGAHTIYGCQSSTGVSGWVDGVQTAEVAGVGITAQPNSPLFIGSQAPGGTTPSSPVVISRVKVTSKGRP